MDKWVGTALEEAGAVSGQRAVTVHERKKGTEVN